MTKKSQYMSNPVKNSTDLCKKADELLKKNAYREAISSYLNALMLKRDNAKTN